MDQEPNLIRQQIDETRSSLTDKLETLENQVRGTVANAKSSVEETIQNVKCTVTDTVQKVKRNLDLGYQVEQHPWAMFGASVAAGFLAGTLLPRRLPSANGWATHERPEERQSRYVPAAPTVSEARLAETEQVSKPSWFGNLLHQFDSEIQQAKELAIGAAVGVVRDLVKQAVPQLGPQIEEVMNSATTKLGGKPIHQSMVEPETSGNPWAARGGSVH